tara:strand:+ start:160 stop:369 length:210 start_codon:yes stop_codon:yes gene_type:complete
MCSAIHNQAIDKAFAKITILGFDVAALKNDIRTGNTGSVTKDELIQVLDGTVKELNIWRFIAESIEKNN